MSKILYKTSYKTLKPDEGDDPDFLFDVECNWATTAAFISSNEGKRIKVVKVERRDWTDVTGEFLE